MEQTRNCAAMCVRGAKAAAVAVLNARVARVLRSASEREGMGCRSEVRKRHREALVIVQFVRDDASAAVQ